MSLFQVCDSCGTKVPPPVPGPGGLDGAQLAELMRVHKEGCTGPTGRAAQPCRHGEPMGTCRDDWCRRRWAFNNGYDLPHPDLPPPGRYVYRPALPERADLHRCDLPAEWIEGAVWRCRDGHLWVVDDACACRGRIELHRGWGVHTVGLAWRPATWWKRRRHGGRKAQLDMANGNQEQASPRLKPPPPQSRGAAGNPTLAPGESATFRYQPGGRIDPMPSPYRKDHPL